jgi:phosphatidylglycerophosphate synthase
MIFAGDKKAGQSLLHGPETRFKNWLIPMVPRGIETYHLTVTTVLWSLLIIVFSFFARYNIHWLWVVSVMIFFQYVTDLLDGAIGRMRNTGLVKWGYYMDHFLDYIFLCSILIGYSLILPDQYKYILFFILALFGAFMANSFLSFATTNEFKIAYLKIGPTEIRLIFIIVNTLLIIFGKTYLARALPFVLAGSTFGLFVVVYRTQKILWKIDMANKQQAGAK